MRLGQPKNMNYLIRYGQNKEFFNDETGMFYLPYIEYICVCELTIKIYNI